MHGRNIDSFLRRFNDPQTAETFNESAAAPAAPRDALAETPSLFLCLSQITQAAAAPTGNQHFSGAAVPPPPTPADAAAAPAAFLLLISQYPQFGCAFVSTHFMCHKPKPAVPGQIIKRPTGNWASGSSTGCGRVSFIRSLKTSELSVGSMYNGVSQQLLH